MTTELFFMDVAAGLNSDAGMISADTELMSNDAGLFSADTGLISANAGLISSSTFVCDEDDTSIANVAVIVVHRFMEVVFFCQTIRSLWLWPLVDVSFSKQNSRTWICIYLMLAFVSFLQRDGL